MHPRFPWLIGLCVVPHLAFSQPPVSTRLAYRTYVAGLPVAEAEAGLQLSPDAYQVTLAYHTTGVVSILFAGRQFNSANGTWNGVLAVPAHFYGHGVWRGQDRIVRIDYDHGLPLVRELTPPNEGEREPVPEPLRDNAIDTVSTLAELVQTIRTTGRCEAQMRTFDGRSAAEIQAVTVGEEVLDRTSRSIFAGKALRCDFTGRMLSGFRIGGNRERDSKPLSGSAWLAAVVPGGPALPVRIVFQTRLFGDATMYLTAAGDGAGPDPAGPPE